jgi:outer membrane protein assembly factor BamE (lipoprotein component of BamABCDE complex)
LLLGPETFNRPFNDRKFTESEWKNFPDVFERARMADDLIENHIHAGMSIEQVTNLLGTPSPQPHQTNSLWYWIGSWSLSPGGADSNWIRFRFDSSGKLTKAEIAGG